MAILPIVAFASAHTGDYRRRLGENRQIARRRLKPVRRRGIVCGGNPAGLTRHRRFVGGLDKGRRRREQALYKVPMIVVHDYRDRCWRRSGAQHP